MTIPVQRPYLGPEESAAVQRVFDSRWLGMGPLTAAFEEALESFLGADHVIAVNSGTSALHLALDMLDLQQGDEVIVPALTFVATTQAVLMTGASPVFCDVDADTFNLDVTDAAKRITPRTKAIVPMHYGGTACDMDAIAQLANDKNLQVVEDAAHAFGSTHQKRMIGTLSELTCFSFDPIKNITCGEGGALVTSKPELAQRATSRRGLGIDKATYARKKTPQPWLYDVTDLGYRYHMSDINAAMGLEQLKRFGDFKRRKREIARRYDEALGNIDGLTLRQQQLDETCPFFYVIRVLDDRRDGLMAHLRNRGIATGVHYIPNHLHTAFAAFRTPLPTVEKLYREILTLPLFYEMTDQQMDTVISEIQRFFTRVPSTILSVRPSRSSGSRPSPSQPPISKES